MGQIGEILGFRLQASIEFERGARTLLDLVRERMDVVDRVVVRRPSLKERLGLKGLGCCGATWGLGPTTISVRDDDEREEEEEEEEEEEDDTTLISQQIEPTGPAQSPISNVPPCVVRSPAMNLAAALAAERQLRDALDSENGGANNNLSPSPRRPNGRDERSPPRPNSRSPDQGTPARVSLMRLLEETDGYDVEMRRDELLDGGVGSDSVCCVCMGRKKGAAFIPCGHTFCRVCSRELWLSRGSCPLCNRNILEILDIY